ASDLPIRLDALESRRADVEVDRNALRQVEKARDELERLLTPSPRYAGERGGERGQRHRKSTDARVQAQPSPLPRPLPGVPGRGSELLRLPLWAYPDRVCRRRAN